jgi:hypothetical protein
MMPATVAADVAAAIDRELRALRREIESYPDERQIWEQVPGIPNSGGTLALHVAGNLQHYAGARWAGTGYVRDRDAEFARRGVSRSEIIEEIERARAAVAVGLARVDDAQTVEDYPEPIAQEWIRTGDYLVHLAVHLAYHLGQLDIHRRVVTGSSEGVGAIRPAELRSARPVED